MDQLLARDDVRLEEISETLVAILQELRTANRREQQRDDRRAAEKASVEEKYASL
jgi:hypothetical protein